MSRGALPAAPDAAVGASGLSPYHPSTLQTMQGEVTYRSMPSIPQSTTFASVSVVPPPPLATFAPPTAKAAPFSPTAPAPSPKPAPAPAGPPQRSALRDYEAGGAGVRCPSLPSEPHALSPSTNVRSGPSSSARSVCDAVTRALLRRGVDFELDAGEGRWRCTLATCCVFVGFVVQAFEAEGGVVVDVSRRHGSPLAFAWVFRAVRCAVLGLADGEADAGALGMVDYHLRSVLPAPEGLFDAPEAQISAPRDGAEGSCGALLRLCGAEQAAQTRLEGVRAISERVALEEERGRVGEDEAEALEVAKVAAEALSAADLRMRSFGASCAANLSESSLFQAKLLRAGAAPRLARAAGDGSHRDAHLRRECARALANLAEGDAAALAAALGKDGVRELLAGAGAVREPKVKGYLLRAGRRLRAAAEVA